MLRNVAERFAPVVWLHKDDEFRPCSVDWYLSRASLEYNRKEPILEVGAVTAKTLVNQKNLNDDSDFTKQNNKSQKFNLRIKNTPENMNGDLSIAECYVHFRDKVDLEIQYWFFYAYNGDVYGLGAHEADWEHITIQFNGLAEPTTKEDIKQIYLSVHGAMHRKNKDDFQFEGNRPAIFSAWHTHANFDVASYGSRDTTLDSTVRWDTWKQGGLKFLEDDPKNELSQVWNKFNGSWGASGGEGDFISTPGIRGKGYPGKHEWTAD